VQTGFCAVGPAAPTVGAAAHRSRWRNGDQGQGSPDGVEDFLSIILSCLSVKLKGYYYSLPPSNNFS
jgi:hypothetical protein